MNNTGWALLVLGVFVLGAGGYYLLGQQQAADLDAATGEMVITQPQTPVSGSEGRDAPVVEPVGEVPTRPQEPAAVVPTPVASPLPSLAQSDEPLLTEARPLFGPQGIPSFLVPRELIAHFVVTIDNLDREPIRQSFQPVRRVSGKPVIDGQTGSEDEKLFLSASNTERYASYISVLEQIDPEQLGTLYRRYAPLFQQAYKNLGYPRARFDQRLIAVIDHLLETPVVAYPIPVVRPKVFYEFADPALEERSWGQKTLIRLGPQQMEVVKQFLREFRAALNS